MHDDVQRGGSIAYGRQQNVGIAHGRDDERAAVVARAAALTVARTDEQQARQGGGGGQPGGRSGGRRGALRCHGLVSDARSRRGRKTRRWKTVWGGGGRGR